DAVTAGEMLSRTRRRPEAGERNGERPPGVSDCENAKGAVSMEQRSAAYHRAAAARARRLRAEATTPWLKEHLENLIAQHEQIAVEIERASEPDRARRRTRRSCRTYASL